MKQSVSQSISQASKSTRKQVSSFTVLETQQGGSTDNVNDQSNAVFVVRAVISMRSYTLNMLHRFGSSCAEQMHTQGEKDLKRFKVQTCSLTACREQIGDSAPIAERQTLDRDYSMDQDKDA